MVEEIWKDVIGYPKLYKVSNYGRLYSYRKNKIIKGTKHHSGYVQIRLIDGLGNKKTTSVHILVAQCFVENPLNKKFVNHKNGVKDDNYFENLEWVTHQENLKHAFNTLHIRSKKEKHPKFRKRPHTQEAKEKMSKAKLGKCGKLHPRSTEIDCFDFKTGRFLKSFESQRIASQELGISQGLICLVLKGDRQQTSGYFFKYKQ